MGVRFKCYLCTVLNANKHPGRLRKCRVIALHYVANSARIKLFKSDLKIIVRLAAVNI